MKNTLIKSFKIFSNTFYIKIFFIIFVFLAEIPLIMQYFNPLLKFGLLFSALYLVLDIFIKRTTLKGQYVFPLTISLFLYAITILINKNEQLISNILSLFYMVVLFLVLFPNSQTDDWKQKDLKEIKVLNYILIVMTSIVALISIIMFLSLYSGFHEFRNVSYPVGFVQNRLTGLYRNAIYPTSSIGLLSAVIQLYILRKENKVKKFNSFLIMSCILLNFIYLSLANSKGLNIGLMVSVCFFVFFIVYKKEKLKTIKWKKILFPILSALISIFMFFGCNFLVRKTFPPLASFVSNQVSSDNSNEEPIPPPNLDRDDIPDSMGMMTGRVFLWELGLEKFMEKPLLGYGAYTLGELRIPNVKEHWSHFHNVYVHGFVSMGILGFFPIILVIFLVFIKALKYLFQKTNEENYYITLSLFALAIFLIVINLADTTLLFFTKHSSFVFWIYLGFLSRLTTENNSSKLDRPLLLLDDKMRKSRLNKSLEENLK